MPCVVSLENFVKILCVKSSWCENFANTLNYGSQPGKMVKNFYSPDRSDKPDFRLQEPDEFDDTAPACYYGYVLDHFGKRVQDVQCKSIFDANNFFPDNYPDAEQCAAQKRRLRCVLPVFYGEEKMKSKNRHRPQSELAKVKGKIHETIEKITGLNTAIALHNRIKDKISVDDVEEFDILFEDSDTDDVDDVHELDADDAEMETNLQVDREFSLEYGFTTDVSRFSAKMSTYFVI